MHFFCVNNMPKTVVTIIKLHKYKGTCNKGGDDDGSDGGGGGDGDGNGNRSSCLFNATGTQ